MKEYVYDVFLSFTGADRELKNTIKEHLSANGLSFYDSDMYCMGQFRDDFCQALDQSRVYLMILTDNLRNDPAISGKGALTEVRRECGLACELEARNELNIVILCMSPFFRYDKPFHDYNDTIGWHFYTHTRGFSRIDGTVDENGVLSSSTLDNILYQCSTFIKKRNAGTPVISQKPRVEIADEKLADKGFFKGREKEIQLALDAFSNGKQMVVLSGLGGMGKTALATEIARKCDEIGFLKCPQIVKIQEITGSGNGLHTIVSSVNYEKNVYDSLTSLSDTDKYRRKLRALSELPENVLLVVDNHNSITNDDLFEILSQLKCKLLITTRSRLDFNGNNAEIINIDCLEMQEAFDVFCDIYGCKIDENEFKILFDFIGGHTITLCIMAKMMRAHGLSVDQLLGELGSDVSTDAKVSFRHNEYGDSDTVLGHLKKLFNITGFSDDSKNILRSMSILGDGTIPLNDLKSVLFLKNMNAVNELSASGWIEIQNRDVQYVYLHPILSRLIASLLCPTEENVLPMIQYLIQRVEDTNQNITYTDASVLEDGLFYALYTISGNDKKLSRRLWDKFVGINHLLGDVENTQKKVSALASRIDDSDKSVVLSYGNMMVIEHHPTRTDILQSFVQSIRTNASNYKWLLRALSVTFGHLYGIKEFESILISAIDTAIDSAIVANDDLALLDLTNYYILHHSGRELSNKLKSYINEQRRTRKITGAFLMLESMYFVCKAFPTCRRSELLNKLSTMISSLSQSHNLEAYKLAIFHPFLFKNITRGQNDAENLPDSDPLAMSWNILIDESYNLAGNAEIDVRKLIDASLNLYMEKVRNGNTFASARDSVIGLVNILATLPQATVKKCTAELVDGTDTDNISIKTLSSLQTATLINQLLGERIAIDQSLCVLNTMLRLRPENHSDIAEAYISHADLCSAFGDSQTAFQFYLKAYETFVKNAEDSAMLPNICRKMLSLSGLNSISTAQICELKDGALSDLKKTDDEYIQVCQNFSRHICNALYSNAINSESKEFLQVFDIADLFKENFHALQKHGQIYCVYTMYNTINMMCNCKKFDIAEHFMAYYPLFKKIKTKYYRRMTKLCHANNNYYIAYKQERDDYEELAIKYIDLCIKYNLDSSGCSTAFWLLFDRICYREKNNYCSVAEQLIKNSSLLTPVIKRIKHAQNFCLGEIKQNDNPVELTESDIEKIKADYFAYLLRTEHKEIQKKNYFISPKEYSKLKSSQHYFAKAISNLFDYLINKYQKIDIPLKRK